MSEPDWQQVVSGEVPGTFTPQEILAARHRQDAERRRVVAVAAAGLGAGIAGLFNALLVHPWTSVEVGGSVAARDPGPPAVFHVALHGAAWAVLVLGVLVLVASRLRGCALVRTWVIGGLFWGAGIFTMLDGLVDRALLRSLELGSYLVWELGAVALMYFGWLALRYRRAYAR